MDRDREGAGSRSVSVVYSYGGYFVIRELEGRLKIFGVGKVLVTILPTIRGKVLTEADPVGSQSIERRDMHGKVFVAKAEVVILHFTQTIYSIRGFIDSVSCPPVGIVPLILVGVLIFGSTKDERRARRSFIRAYCKERDWLRFAKIGIVGIGYPRRH